MLTRQQGKSRRINATRCQLTLATVLRRRNPLGTRLPRLEHSWQVTCRGGGRCQADSFTCWINQHGLTFHPTSFWMDATVFCTPCVEWSIIEDAPFVAQWVGWVIHWLKGWWFESWLQLSTGKTLNPEWLPMGLAKHCMAAATHFGIWLCDVCEWVNKM